MFFSRKLCVYDRGIWGKTSASKKGGSITPIITHTLPEYSISGDIIADICGVFSLSHDLLFFFSCWSFSHHVCCLVALSIVYLITYYSSVKIDNVQRINKKFVSIVFFY